MIGSIETRLLHINPQAPEPALINDAARTLQAGRLVAFPTETVYGLGAHALYGDAVSRIFAAKERPASDPLIVHIAELEQLAQVGTNIPPLAEELAARFWPGPLTLVVQRAARIPYTVTAGGETVAVRMPAHPVALALIRAAGPIAAPSANRFSRPSPTSAQHVLDDLRGRVDLILDGGPVSIGIESTVLDLTVDPPTVLRPGGTPLESLREVIPHVAIKTTYLADDSQATSPGMLLKHYAPEAALLLFEGPRSRVLPRMQQTAQDRLATGQRVGVLTTDTDRAHFANLPCDIISTGSDADLASMAAGLFAALRQLDALHCDVIIARTPAPVGLGLAIRDRLIRAAEGRLILVDEA